MTGTERNEYLNQWLSNQELSEEMQPMIGKLYRNCGVLLRIHNRPLTNSSTIQLLKDHRYVRRLFGDELKIQDSYQMVKAMSSLELGPSVVDLGRMTHQWVKAGRPDAKEYVAQTLKSVIGTDKAPLKQPQDVVLYGFGRIGRLLARLLIEKTGPGNKLRLSAIVVRKGTTEDLQKRASLLRRDSVHGPFRGTITVDTEKHCIIANGCMIQVIYASSPDEVDYTAYGIKDAIVVDNTGKWRDEQGLSLHLAAKGVKKALLTAPAKGDIKNIVYGVNHDTLSDEDRIVSAASCTTNAITPVLQALNEKYGIENGHVETVHAFTNDQNLIDNFHKKERRGRAASLNMVLTETGAAKAVSKALPELAGKLTGNAIRVPTPNVSMAVLNLNLGKSTNKDELNEYLRSVSVESRWGEQIDYVASPEVVSSDLVGSRHAGIVDSKATIASDKRCVLYVWYDNEFGYSCQVIRIVQNMAGLNYQKLP